MCGTAKSGKSFLANRYLGRMQGFKTRGPLGSGTKGIWMWNQMVPLGNETDGILLDCQGMSLEDAECEDNTSSELEEKLFTLAVLLASQLVFNTRGHITDQTMDELSLLPLLQSKIKIREERKAEMGGGDYGEDEDFSSDEEGDSAEFYKFFP